MLILERRVGKKINVGDNITITVTQVRGERVWLGFDAPRDVRIMRGEIDQERIGKTLRRFFGTEGKR